MPVPLVFNLALAPGCGLGSMTWMCCSPCTARNAGVGAGVGAVGVLVSLHAATIIAPAAASGRHRFIAAPPSNKGDSNIAPSERGRPRNRQFLIATNYDCGTRRPGRSIGRPVVNACIHAGTSLRWGCLLTAEARYLSPSPCTYRRRCTSDDFAPWELGWVSGG